MPREGEEEGWSAKGRRRKKGRVKTGQEGTWKAEARLFFETTCTLGVRPAKTPFWTKVGDRRGTTKKLGDKDFAERSVELSGAICLKTLVLLGDDLVTPSNCSENSLALFVRFFGFVSPLLGNIWSPQPSRFSQKYCDTNGRRIAMAYCDANGRRTAIQIGGVLKYSPFLRAQWHRQHCNANWRRIAMQIGYVLRCFFGEVVLLRFLAFSEKKGWQRQGVGARRFFPRQRFGLLDCLSFLL